MRNINSLKNSSQFRNVYQNGKSIANRYLVMYVLPTEGEFRLGISVSKKVGNSVTRHRITRLIRESYVSCKNSMTEGYDVVIVARGEAKEAGLDEIRNAFGHLIRKHRI